MFQLSILPKSVVCDSFWMNGTNNRQIIDQESNENPRANVTAINVAIWMHTANYVFVTIAKRHDEVRSTNDALPTVTELTCERCVCVVSMTCKKHLPQCQSCVTNTHGMCHSTSSALWIDHLLHWQHWGDGHASQLYSASRPLRIYPCCLTTVIIHHSIPVSLQAQNLPVSQIISTLDFLPSPSGLTPRFLARHRFFWAYPFLFFSFLIFLVLVFGSVR